MRKKWYGEPAGVGRAAPLNPKATRYARKLPS
jgi:hypothetical protein